MSKKGWLEKNYKVGQVVQAPHPADTGDRAGQLRPAKIVNFTRDRSGPIGLTVQFEDSVFIEIDAGYLNETGGGV